MKLTYEPAVSFKEKEKLVCFIISPLGYLTGGVSEWQKNLNFKG